MKMLKLDLIIEYMQPYVILQNAFAALQLFIVRVQGFNNAAQLVQLVKK